MTSRAHRSRTAEAPRDALVRLVTELKEEEALEILRAQLLQGASPLDLLGACMEGVRRVGERYAEGRYFMAALIMAGEIMREATELLGPQLEHGRPAAGGGRVLLATVRGDIHDLGKNLFALLLRCNGFEVDDLGVDVGAAALAERAAETGPDLVGLSCILTSSVEELRETVALLKKGEGAGRPRVIIGGCAVDARIQEYVRADLWAPDAAVGVELCRAVLDEKRRGLSSGRRGD